MTEFEKYYSGERLSDYKEDYYLPKWIINLKDYFVKENQWINQRPEDRPGI